MTPTGAARAGARGRKRYVVMVLPSMTMGGTEAQLASMLEASTSYLSVTRVTLLTFLPERNPHLERRFTALGLRIDTIDRSKMGFGPFFLALVRYFRKERPALVHAFLAGSTGTWGRLAARLAGVPYVMLSDRSLEPSMTRLQRLIDPWVRHLTHRFLPNAEATARRLERSGVPRDRIMLVRNGVDLDRFDPERVGVSFRAEWQIPDDAIVAGFLGMFREEKRPELLVEAVAALPERDRPDFVVMAGTGALLEVVQHRIDRDPGLKQRFRLLGVVGDTPRFLASIDFLVLTSDAEGMPNAIMEAMAMAKPCVATSVSDVPYLLQSADHLAEKGNSSSIAEAIRKMTALTPLERSDLGRLGRQRAKREFAMPVAAERFWSAHEDFLPPLTDRRGS